MKFVIKVKIKGNPDSTAWTEIYDKNVDDPEKYGREAVDLWNNTLQSHEQAREFVSVVSVDKDSREEHTWSKQNLVSIDDGKDIYDIMKCTECGITARRYGMNVIVLDAKFRKAKVYLRCDTAEKHLERKRLREEAKQSS